MYEITRQRRFNKSGLILAGLFLLMMVGAFYGCQFLQPKTNPAELNDQMPLYRRIGILKSLGGVKTSSSGTHILQLDDGATILLKSLQINLDDAAYLGKTVEVRGILTYTTDKKQIMEVMNIDLVQEEADAASAAVSWKEFASADMGLSIKYRDDLKFEEAGAKLIFSKEKVAAEKLITTTETTTESTMETTAEKVAGTVLHKMTIEKESLAADDTIYSKAGVTGVDTEMLASGVSRSRIGSGSYDALKKVEGYRTLYYIAAGKSFYKIEIDAGSDESTLQDQNLFYEMLGTMKLDSATSVTADSDVGNNGTQVTSETAEETKVTEQTEETEKPESTTRSSTQEPEQAQTQAAKPDSTQETVQTQESADTPAEALSLDGYEKLESESFKFSMQYPKSWFYSGSAGTDAGVIRHYEFGSKPLEEIPGDVSMDLMSGSIPSGTASNIGGKDVTVVNTSSGVEVYVKGAGSRIYRFSGPSSDKATLMNMAASISE